MPRASAAAVSPRMGQGVVVVPRGCNGGTCGAATPSTDGPALVPRLNRLDRIRDIDRPGASTAVDAGRTPA